MTVRVCVAVDSPQHSGLGDWLDYVHDSPLPLGAVVRVPLGKREVTGIVWSAPNGSDIATDALRPVSQVLTGLAPLPSDWMALVEFGARYYQRGVGEVALSVLPPELRKLDDTQLGRRLKRLRKVDGLPTETVESPALNAEQLHALDLLAHDDAGTAATLLHGVTGSGKTEIYLHAAARVLQSGRQVLVLVPEINLTPQLIARFAARFGEQRVVAMHSGLTPAQRLRHWLRAHAGDADLVLGTRLAVFASLPRLGLIVVDEEHDPSYKQQDGARYSARDLAVYRGRLVGAQVLLGSATPSLESWQRVEEGRYRRITLTQRIGGGSLPRVRLFDMNQLPRAPGVTTALAPALIDALAQRLAAGEQSLLFLNRRGYAPVLHCTECGWKSACKHCSAWRVFHRADRTLRCHHCGWSERVPRACPDCGNLDIAPLGSGTEKLEEQVAQALPGARVLRIDADSSRGAGQLEAQLNAVHDGDVDILVGTQMVAKGHDFRRITLVAAVNPDGALFSSDFRAPERLFSLLMQAGGRAGREAEQASRSEMWVQTWHPQHPLYAALVRHDYAAFARSQLAERAAAGLPPYAHLALLRADARAASTAQDFLEAAAALARALPEAEPVMLYPPIAPTLARVANVERMQLLIESPSRADLQRLLARWLPLLLDLRRSHKGLVRWAVDVDPLAI